MFLQSLYDELLQLYNSCALHPALFVVLPPTVAYPSALGKSGPKARSKDVVDANSGLSLYKFLSVPLVAYGLLSALYQFSVVIVE